MSASKATIADRVSPEGSLVELFVALYSTEDELRNMVVHLADGPDVLKALAKGSLEETAHRLTLALAARNMITADLFECLLAERPRKRPAIAAVAERWDVPSTTLSAPAPGHAGRRRGAPWPLVGVLAACVVAALALQAWQRRATGEAEEKPPDRSIVAVTSLPITPPKRVRAPDDPKAPAGPLTSTPVTTSRLPAATTRRVCSDAVQSWYSPTIANEARLGRRLALRIEVRRTGAASASLVSEAPQEADAALAAVNQAFAGATKTWANTEVPCDYEFPWRP